MKLLFMGVQGSGKGTQAKIIAEKLKIPHISSGDLLRNISKDSPLKKEVDHFMQLGQLVKDDLLVRLIFERLNKEDCKKGFILDGTPRNMIQAKELEKNNIKIDNAVLIEISDKEATKRLKGRWNCKKCGTSYNYVTSPKPKQEGICDKCGEKLYQREDDINDKAIKQRLRLYHTEVSPVLKFYNTIRVNGEQSIEKVTQDIINALKQ